MVYSIPYNNSVSSWLLCVVGLNSVAVTVWKSKWLSKDYFLHVVPEYLVFDYLQSMSYSLRMLLDVEFVEERPIQKPFIFLLRGGLF